LRRLQADAACGVGDRQDMSETVCVSARNMLLPRRRRQSLK
jgi:hypothetical protein